MIHAFSSRFRRRGYSLTVVLLFLVLLLFLWAAVYRTTASFLRVETARVKRNDLDNGMLGALAQALWYVETNPTPCAGSCGFSVPLNPNNPNNPNNPQKLDFTATFTPVTPVPPNWSNWSIKVVPGYCPTSPSSMFGS
jgi:hypothetical protein